MSTNKKNSIATLLAKARASQATPPLLGTTAGVGLLGGAWSPQTIDTVSDEFDPHAHIYADWRDLHKEYQQSEEVMRQFQEHMRQLEEARQLAKRRMSKEQILQGILSEMVAMREKLDQLTATVAAEILVDQGPEKAK